MSAPTPRDDVMMNVMNLRPTLEVDRHDLLRLVRPRSLDSRPLISLRGVSRLYDGGAITALQNGDLQIDAGDCMAIVGASGSGGAPKITVKDFDDPKARAMHDVDLDLSDSARALIRNGINIDDRTAVESALSDSAGYTHDPACSRATSTRSSKRRATMRPRARWTRPEQTQVAGLGGRSGTLLARSCQGRFTNGCFMSMIWSGRERNRSCWSPVARVAGQMRGLRHSSPLSPRPQALPILG
jgi:hypothetical protein